MRLNPIIMASALISCISIAPLCCATTQLTCPSTRQLQTICGEHDKNNIAYPECLMLKIGNQISFDQTYHWQVVGMRPAFFSQPLIFYAVTINKKGVSCIYSNKQRHYLYLSLHSDAHTEPLKSQPQTAWHNNTDSKHHADTLTHQETTSSENRYFCISQGNPQQCPMSYTRQTQRIPTQSRILLEQRN